ncbi:hypothetical protein AB395_00003811 [Sinorhizobium fredii CCBAU 45436]|nr:hypothetical protein SF83666_c36600 [Sinorhizobium fredii CCBAU 83666]AWI59438.1 hypothetical protein AB395_00003811 [Sinorhizobium fredii CCBAU 45436]
MIFLAFWLAADPAVGGAPLVIENAVAVTDRALELAGNRGLRRD